MVMICRKFRAELAKFYNVADKKSFSNFLLAKINIRCKSSQPVGVLKLPSVMQVSNYGTWCKCAYHLSLLYARYKLDSVMLFILIGSNIVSLGRNKIGDAEVLTCNCEYPRAPCSIKGLRIKHAAIYKNCLFSTQLIQRSLKLATHTTERSRSWERARV